MAKTWPHPIVPLPFDIHRVFERNFTKIAGCTQAMGPYFYADIFSSSVETNFHPLQIHMDGWNFGPYF